MSVLGNYWRAFEPAPDIGIAEYSIRWIFNEEGRPFDYLQYWHMVAPGGPMDAFDSIATREIVMQWASRLGKTFVVLCGSLYLMDLAPCNQILAGNSEQLGLQQTERVRQMGDQIPHLREGLQRTQKRRLRCHGSTVYAAWAKSPVTLSNINAMFGGASELDLWEQATTSKHPDPEEMFGDRFKNEDSRRKEIYESIPTLSGTHMVEIGGVETERPRSRIAARRMRGSDCRLWLGCPSCGGRQVLTDERITAAGYECEHCSTVITDEYRKEFIRSGVWAPRGCVVDPDKATAAAAQRLELLGEVSELPEGDERLPELRRQLAWSEWADCDYLTGTPENDGPVWSSQLSSYYALSLTWGRLAAAKSDSQNYVNQWQGLTMEVEEDEEIDLEAAGRALSGAITGELAVGEVPDWAEYVVFSSDKQLRTYPWQVTAWSPAVDRVQIVDCGCVFTLEEVEKLASAKRGGRYVDMALMDCGYMEQDVYDFCLEQTLKQPFRFWPVKGDKASVVKLHFVENRIKDEVRKSNQYRKLRRVHINSQSTQEWCTHLLDQRKAVHLCKAAPSDHEWLCQELLNEQEIVQTADNKWERIRTNVPNDQRDCLRYGYAGALLVKKHSGKRRKTANTAQNTSTEPTGDGLFRMVGPSERPTLRPY